MQTSVNQQSSNKIFKLMTVDLFLVTHEKGREMGSYIQILSMLVCIVLLFVFGVIYGLLIKQDEEKQYFFKDFRLQFNDVQGERLCCEITLYPWQKHKLREINAYYQVGRIVSNLGHVYEINEIRGPYKCKNAIFQEVLRFYVSEKKKIDTAYIEGNTVHVFHDKTIYFDTTPYLQEIEEAYSFMCKSELDEHKKERVRLLFSDLYEMSTTNIILAQKLMYYVGALSEFSMINKNLEQLKILNILTEIMKYLKETNIETFEDRMDMPKDNVTLHFNGQVNIARDGSNIYAIQNNNISIDEVDIMVRNIMQNLSEVSREDAETIVDAVEMVQEEIKKNEPNKKVISNGIKLIATMISVVNGIPDLAENLKKFVEYISAMIK